MLYQSGSQVQFLQIFFKIFFLIRFCRLNFSDNPLSQRTLTVGVSITVRLVSSLTGLESTDHDNRWKYGVIDM